MKRYLGRARRMVAFASIVAIMAAAGIAPADAIDSPTGSIRGSISVPADFQSSQISIELVDLYNSHIASAKPSTSWHFNIDYLAAKPYKMVFRDSLKRVPDMWFGGVPDSSSATVIQVPKNGSIDRLEAEPWGELGSIIGRTVDPSGEPLAGARVTASSPWSGTNIVTSDQNGFYRLGNLAAGKYDLSFLVNDGRLDQPYWDSSGNRAELRVEVAVGKQNTAPDVILRLGAQVRVSVDTPEGLRFEGLTAHFLREDGSEISQANNLPGQRQLLPVSLPAGDYNIRITSGDGRVASGWFGDVPTKEGARKISVRFGEAITDVRVRLGRPGSISGRIKVQETGGPADNAVLHAIDSSGFEASSANADGRGDYVLAGLPPGKYRVRFDEQRSEFASMTYGGAAGEAVGAPQWIEVVAGSVTDEIDMSIRKGGVISTSVVDASGSTIGPMQVDAYPVDGAGSPRIGWVDPQGLAKVSGLSDGSYILVVNPSGGVFNSSFPTFYSGNTLDKEAATAYVVKIGAVANVAPVSLPSSVKIRPVPPSIQSVQNVGTVATIDLAGSSDGTVTTSITATVDPGGSQCTVSGETGRCNIGGLTPSTQYSISAVAVNRSGISAPGSRWLFSTESSPLARAGGADRYATSAAVSEAAFASNIDVAYVAAGSNFPDALSGAAAAGSLNGPVLLVTRDGVPAPVEAELKRLKPKRIVILGGAGILSGKLSTKLKSYTSKVARAGGIDRYATSAAVSEATFKPDVSVAYVAAGSNFPDALSGAAAAGSLNGPVLLVTRDGVPAPVEAELKRLKPKRIVILGGLGVLSERLSSRLRTFVPQP